MNRARRTILLLLAVEPRTGRALVEAADDTLGRGTVYVHLQALEERGFVRSEILPNSDDGLPQRRYTITATGRACVAAALPPPDADAYEREVLTTPRPTVRSTLRKYRLAFAVPIVMLLVQALVLGVLAPDPADLVPRTVAAFWLVFFVLSFGTLLRRERDRWQRRRERALRSIAMRRDEDASP